jgi:hypothetical protein
LVGQLGGLVSAPETSPSQAPHLDFGIAQSIYDRHSDGMASPISLSLTSVTGEPS